MRILVATLSLLLLTQCGGKTEEKVDPQYINIDTLAPLTIDSSLFITEKDTTHHNIVDLFDNGFDLHDFKNEWGASHSGGVSNQDFYETPDTLGMVYHYFFFFKLRQKGIVDISEGELFDSFGIYVWKFGEEPGSFYDTTELFLGLYASIPLSVLNDFDLVGKSKDEIRNWIGEPHFREEECWIYTYNHHVLGMSMANEKVEWFKFAHINHQTDLKEDIPAYFLNYK